MVLLGEAVKREQAARRRADVARAAVSKGRAAALEVNNQLTAAARDAAATRRAQRDGVHKGRQMDAEGSVRRDEAPARPATGIEEQPPA